MKIMIVSDSHGDMENITEAINREKPLDMLVHCGDAEGTEGDISILAECPIWAVLGNNDFFSMLSKEHEFEIDGGRAFLTHGHYYHVSMGPQRIIEEGMSREADYVFFGHTHRPFIEEYDGMWVINPGSIAYPRQEGRDCTYIIMNINDQGEVEFELKTL